jgi:hypothetical protein
MDQHQNFPIHIYATPIELLFTRYVIQVFHFDVVRKDEAYACPYRSLVVDAPAEDGEEEEEDEDEDATAGVGDFDAVEVEVPAGETAARDVDAGAGNLQHEFPVSATLRCGSHYAGVVRCYDDRAHALYVVYEDGDCGWSQPWRPYEFWHVISK